MSEEDQVLKLISVITEQPLDSININSSMDNTQGWDSLAHLNIVNGIEKIIDRQLTLEEIILANCVEDWIKIIQKYQ